ncbi:MAG: conserved exported hypothetical protein (AmoD2) [Nitrospira sp.]|nr:MAG: conserved exported hypothetical protein (AmoD2) [Nitrospira sp.]
MSLQFLKPACVCFVMLAIGLPFAAQAQHGGHELEKDLCILHIGPYRMYFNSYQPKTTYDKQFCQDLPATGHTVVVLDYLEHELRSLPLEVRIIRDTGSEQDLQAVTVLHMPAKVYPSGSVDIAYNFDKPGKFVGLVTVGDQQQHVGRFPFSVGESGTISHFMHYIMVMAPLAAIAAVAATFFFFRGRRKSSEITVS